MNLTAARPLLVGELGYLVALLNAQNHVRSPELQTILEDFEVVRLDFEKEGDPVHGRTLLEKAVSISDEIRIVLVPRTKNTTKPSRDLEIPVPAAANIKEPQNPESELLESLRTAKQGRKFVALKWFRDQWLPQQQYPWCKDPEAVRVTLRGAIDKGILRKELLQNPNNPDHPTTTLQEGNSITESVSHGSASLRKFTPLVLPGKPFSEMVIEGR